MARVHNPATPRLSGLSFYSLLLCLYSLAHTVLGQTPTPVQEMAFARAGRLLYVQVTTWIEFYRAFFFHEQTRFPLFLLTCLFSQLKLVPRVARLIPTESARPSPTSFTRSISPQTGLLPPRPGSVSLRATQTFFSTPWPHQTISPSTPSPRLPTTPFPLESTTFRPIRGTLPLSFRVLATKFARRPGLSLIRGQGLSI